MKAVVWGCPPLLASCGGSHDPLVTIPSTWRRTRSAIGPCGSCSSPHNDALRSCLACRARDAASPDRLLAFAYALLPSRLARRRPFLDWPEMAAAVVKRRTSRSLHCVLRLLPLAATSPPDGRRLGGVAWRRLHRLVTLSGSGSAHYFGSLRSLQGPYYDAAWLRSSSRPDRRRLRRARARARRAAPRAALPDLRGPSLARKRAPLPSRARMCYRDRSRPVVPNAQEGTR